MTGVQFLARPSAVLGFRWKDRFCPQTQGTSQMTLFTQVQTKKLLANCQEQIMNNDAGDSDIDFKPVVKLFTPDAQYTWLLTELGNDDIAYGLCDLGIGCAEIGY